MDRGYREHLTFSMQFCNFVLQTVAHNLYAKMLGPVFKVGLGYNLLTHLVKEQLGLGNFVFPKKHFKRHTGPHFGLCVLL